LQYFFKPQRLKWNVACFPRIIFPYFFSNRNVWNTSLLVFRVSFSCTCSNRNVWNTSLLVWCYQTFSRTFSKTNSFLSQNLFFTSFIFYLFLLQNVPILQHVIASKSNHSNTMLPNVMVLAPLQKLKIKYELSCQSTTRLKYIDKFDQLLITPQWTSTVDNTVRSLIHLTIFYLILCSKTFPIIYKIIIKKLVSN
jgi:hypothetical protein